MSKKISIVQADRQHALELTVVGQKPPDSSQLIRLTAIVEDDGEPVGKGTRVYWSATNFHNRGAVFYNADSDDNPLIITDRNDPRYPSPSKDTAVSLTDQNGRAIILVASPGKVIGTIHAELEREGEKQSPSLPSGPNYQNVAFCTFADNDDDASLATPTGFGIGDHGIVDLEPIDGSQYPAPEESGLITNGPDFSDSSHKGEGPIKDSLCIIWACSGSDYTGLGQLIGVPFTWRGGPLDKDIPFGIFSKEDNKLAYMFFGGGSALYSHVLRFSFSRNPIHRPDDSGYSPDPSLAAVKFVEATPDLFTGKPKVDDIPRQLGTSGFDKDMNLRFAIPAPKDEDGNDDYDEKDVIVVDFYLNGWDSTKRTYLQSKTYSFKTTAARFEKNYDSKGDTYLPLFLTKQDCTGFGPNGNTNRPGYFWTQYTYNGSPSLLPSPPVRIDFPGPRPSDAESSGSDSSKTPN